MMGPFESWVLAAVFVVACAYVVLYVVRRVIR